MHIHESCLLWQGLERLWFESWKLGFQCMLSWMFLGLCVPTIGSSHILIHQSYILIWRKASGSRNKWFWAADCQWPWLLARPFQAHNEVKYSSIYGASFCFPNPLTRMWHLVTTSQLLLSSFWLGRWEMLLYLGFYEVESSTIGSLPICPLWVCLHDASTYRKICYMWNALSNGK
jgi:hypothetical protein